MLKDPGFAAADKALNQAWSEAKKIMPKAAFEALKKIIYKLKQVVLVYSFF